MNMIYNTIKPDMIYFSFTKCNVWNTLLTWNFDLYVLQKLIQLQKLAALFSGQPQINFGNTNNMTPVTSTNSTVEVDMEPEAANTPGGNLPNFAFI